MNYVDEVIAAGADRDKWGNIRSMCLSDLLNLHAEVTEKHVSTLTNLEAACRVIPGYDAHRDVLFLKCLASTSIETFDLKNEINALKLTRNEEERPHQDLSVETGGIEDLLEAVGKILQALERIEYEVMARTPQTREECCLSVQFLSEMMQDGYEFPRTYVTRILSDCSKVFGMSDAMSPFVH